MTFKVVFATNAPVDLEEHVLYISIEYAMAIHLCPCGCKCKVATKISPSRWSMTFDGETVSLSPSIRASNMTCQSHYWIIKNRIQWAYDYHKGGKPKKKSKKKFKFWQKK